MCDVVLQGVVDVVGWFVLCAVMLQPVSGGGRPDTDCAHKFIVEAIFAPDGEVASLERLVNHATRSITHTG